MAPVTTQAPRATKPRLACKARQQVRCQVRRIQLHRGCRGGGALLRQRRHLRRDQRRLEAACGRLKWPHRYAVATRYPHALRTRSGLLVQLHMLSQDGLNCHERPQSLAEPGELFTWRFSSGSVLCVTTCQDFCAAHQPPERRIHTGAYLPLHSVQPQRAWRNSSVLAHGENTAVPHTRLSLHQQACFAAGSLAYDPSPAPQLHEGGARQRIAGAG